LAAAAAAALVRRAEERARLATLLEPDGPAAVFVHGPGGIGKTALVTGTLASVPLKVVTLDARQVEPTMPGLWRRWAPLSVSQHRRQRMRPAARSQTRGLTSL
jgi:hypothetical protein